MFTKTGDWNSVTLKTVPDGKTFGCVIGKVNFTRKEAKLTTILQTDDLVK